MSANDELQAHTCEKMLQEYGNVANNVAQSKVQDLTERWKNGELEVGEYYLRYKDGTIDREYYDYANVYDLMVEKGFSTESCDISEVLAPVPSYEEWQAKEEEILQLKQKVTSRNKRLQKYKRRIDEISKLASNRNILIKQLKEDNRIFEEKIHNSYMEIGQLKKLLKDYREVIYMAKGHPDAFIHMEFLNNILFKINEVLK